MPAFALLDSEFDGDSAVDYPNVRADQTCPLCLGRKDIGLTACWTCYRVRGLNIVAGADDGAIMNRERYLAALTCS